MGRDNMTPAEPGGDGFDGNTPEEPNYKYLSEEYDATDPFANGGEASVDPFEGNPAAGLNFIMLNRIYDVLMAQLRIADTATAQDLLAAHMSGLLLGPTPWMNGEFVTDILNEDEDV